MPELPDGLPKPPNTLDIEKLKMYRKMLETEEGREVLGQGKESLVEILPSDETKVAAHSLDMFGDYRRVYYVHRVLETLFPNHFPHIAAAFEHTNTRQGGTIRERVYGTPVQGSSVSFSEEKSFKQVTDVLGSMGIRQGIDMEPVNFLKDDAGYEKYLDVAPALSHAFIGHEQKIMEYMNSYHFSEEAKRTVGTAIKRLVALRARARSNKPSK